MMSPHSVYFSFSIVLNECGLFHHITTWHFSAFCCWFWKVLSSHIYFASFLKKTIQAIWLATIKYLYTILIINSYQAKAISFFSLLLPEMLVFMWKNHPLPLYTVTIGSDIHSDNSPKRMTVQNCIYLFTLFLWLIFY